MRISDWTSDVCSSDLFPADAAVSATLVDGPITDLNVMTRRGRFCSRVRRIDAAAEVALASAVVFLLAEAPCRAAVDSGVATPGRHDALRLDGPDARLPAISADGPVSAYLVELLRA